MENIPSRMINVKNHPLQNDIPFTWRKCFWIPYPSDIPSKTEFCYYIQRYAVVNNAHFKFLKNLDDLLFDRFKKEIQMVSSATVSYPCFHEPEKGLSFYLFQTEVFDA